MTTMAKASVVTRETVGKLEHRFGRKGLYLGGSVILLVVLGLMLRGFTSKEKAPTRPPPRPVAAAKVITQDVPLYIDEIGTCAAFETVQVQAQVNGQIIERHFQDGADVKKGDPLFTIDPRPYEAALATAQADLALNQANLKRQEVLRKQNVTANQEWDTAEANARKAEAAVKAAQVNLDHCYIKSPIDGRVGLRNIDVGNVVGGGSGTVLVTIQGMDPIYTDFTVAEPDLPLVRRYLNGEKLKVLTDAEDDELPPREGELTFIDNSLQPGTGTVKARATTPNPDRALWPSQFVRARLILETLKDSKLVPSSAVQIGQNGPYVFVVKDDSTLELRQVRPGQRHGDLTVVSEGVNAGERVVISGQLQLAPGAKVSVQEVEAIAPGAQPALGNSAK
jgi:multidrug efflux system membrane fusion protein